MAGRAKPLSVPAVETTSAGLSAPAAVAVISNAMTRRDDSACRRRLAKRRFCLCAALLSALLQACAAPRLPVSPIPATADPQNEIVKLSAEIDHARAESLNVLSPGRFSEAAASLAKARTLHGRKAGAADVLAAVAEGHAELDKGFDVADLSGEVLGPALAARAAARAAGATAYEDAYARAEKALISLTRSVEAGKTDEAKKGQEEVAKEFRVLELCAIKETTLRSVREVMAQARADGAVRYAPRMLAATERKVASVEAFIAAQPHARSEMNAHAGEALLAARRLAALTHRAREIGVDGPEDSAVKEDRLLAALSEALKLPESRDRSFEQRRTSIVDAVGRLAADRDYLVGQNRQLRAEVAQAKVDRTRIEGQSAEERARLQQLEAERRFRRLYDEVSGYFQPGEAQVYKQADRLVIRLHGLKFPVGTAALTPDGYAMLSKVQKAIRAFGDPNVIVEGHTDDTGPSALNDQLSQRRADAVRDYLVSNNVLPGGRIRAVGKGFSEPVASNKSAKGRALNRRIDVIIEPLGPPAAGEDQAMPR